MPAHQLNAMQDAAPLESFQPIKQLSPHWVESHSGRTVDLLNPSPEMFCLEDIAIGLAHTNRFSGQTLIPYDVAMHSIWVAQYIVCKYSADEPTVLEAALYGLLHDAAEAYIGDVVTPLKNMDGIKQQMQIVEHQLLRNIYIALNLPGPNAIQKRMIAYADRQALAVEATQLMRSSGRQWDLPPLDIPAKWLFDLYPANFTASPAKSFITLFNVLTKFIKETDEEAPRRGDLGNLKAAFKSQTTQRKNE